MARQKTNGAHQRRGGDFTGGSIDDIFWYGPGAKPDATWFMSPSSADAKSSPTAPADLPDDDRP